MEHEKLQQLLEMLLYMSSGIKHTKAEIMNRFNIKERTFYRDMETLRTVGFIIPRPKNSHYYIDQESPYFREIDQLLHFSKEEAYILQKAIHSIDDQNILKQNLVKKLYALYDFNRVADTIVKPENSENVHYLMNAIKDKKRVILHNYQSANSDKVSNRLVEPFDFTTNYIATWAYDVESGTCKTFRNTRLSSVEVLNDDWENESQHSTLPIDVFRMSSKKQIPVEVRMSLRASDLLKEEYPMAGQYIKPDKNNLFLLKTEVCGFEGVGRFVLGLIEEVEILSPPQLLDFIKNKIKKSSTDII